MENSNLVSRLQKILDDAVASGEECGCQLAVYQHGKLLCRLHAGQLAPNCSVPVDDETLFPIFSVGKGIVTTLMHRLVEKGLCSYEDRIAQYWPEFGCRGKEDTRIWQMMSHRAGLWQIAPEFGFANWFHWEKIAGYLAQAVPADVIGGMHHYHAHTYGVLVGYLAERITGKRLRNLLEEELFRPLEIRNIHFGIQPADYANLAMIDESTLSVHDMRAEFNQQACLCGCNPSSNGCANATELAKFYAALLPEGYLNENGTRIYSLKEETLQRATRLCRCPEDQDFTQWDKFGLGYALCGPEGNFSRMFGHGGACGSEGFCDRETGYAVGFTKNRLNVTHPVHPTRNAISQALGIPCRVW